MQKLKPLLLLALLLATGSAFLFLPMRQWFLLLQGHIEALGVLAPFVVVVAYVALTVLLIPGSALTLGASTIFGFWKGLAIVLAGANLGALCSFLLARTLMREKVALWAAAHPKFAALDRAIGQNDFKMVFLARLSPVFPFTLLNYLLGLTTVRMVAYILANLFGMLPGTVLYVYLGATAREALAGSAATGATLWQQALKVVGLLATIAIVIGVTRSARKVMAQADAETANSTVSNSPTSETSR
ncbi:MAG: TVP38/TMEM64 family protein [Acidobacteria bacterium]|nr:TVP38/TMEM64 family protein [Acidobacteriota bacterium]MBI3422397.1 TVP38/TMEM64 family protein [Acidobacteriota bacterium]